MNESYGWAIKQMHHGLKVRRTGWYGPGQWVAIRYPTPSSDMSVPYTYIRTVTGDLVPWTPSQTDQLAIDWGLADD